MLDLWDHEGVKHEMRLYTTPVLTAKGKTAQLDIADMEYIAQHNIPLSRSECERSSKPQILLGCDQLWTLLDVPYPRHTLPSGLLLVPSKLGYLLTGRQMEAPQNTEQVERNTSEAATFVNNITNIDEELERLREIRRIVRQLEDVSISVVFGYISTSENPADAGTRGLTKEQITDHCWWSGPPFLRTPIQQWSNPTYPLVRNDAPTFVESENGQTANINVCCGESTGLGDLLQGSRYNSLTAAKRITALVLRFIKKLLRNKCETFKTRILAHVPELHNIKDSIGPLEGSEIRAANLFMRLKNIANPWKIHCDFIRTKTKYGAQRED
ncbi:hypothetical protein COOONC_15933 [Cooperia oncophora]